MNYSKFRFTLDIHKHQSQVSVAVMRGDTAVQLYIALSDGGLPYEIGDSCFAIIIGNKPDGTTFRHPCVIEGGVIRYDLQPETSDLSGASLCEVRLYGTNGILTAPCFTIVVDERIPHYDEAVPADAITALDQVFLNEAIRVAAENERAKADKARWEYFASLYYPALDGILALQDTLIGGVHALYKLNEDGQSYTCIGGPNIETIVIADAVGDKPVTAIAPYAFKNYDKLRSITIPPSIKTIGTDAFLGCAAIETIYFNAAAMSDFEELASPFKYCGMNAPNGTALVIGNAVTKIPKYLFHTNNVGAELCNNLTSLSFKEAPICTQIRQSSFHGCANLVDIEIAYSVELLQGHNFRGVGATSIKFAENSKLNKVGACAFKRSNLKSITFPASVMDYSNDACAECEMLESVTFTSKPNSIDDTAFANCPNLTDIYAAWGTNDNPSYAPWGATNATIHYQGIVTPDYPMGDEWT